MRCRMKSLRLDGVSPYQFAATLGEAMRCRVNSLRLDGVSPYQKGRGYIIPRNSLAVTDRSRA
jgi:hypothetical protein